MRQWTDRPFVRGAQHRTPLSTVRRLSTANCPPRSFHCSPFHNRPSITVRPLFTVHHRPMSTVHRPSTTVHRRSSLAVRHPPFRKVGSEIKVRHPPSADLSVPTLTTPCPPFCIRCPPSVVLRRLSTLHYLATRGQFEGGLPIPAGAVRPFLDEARSGGPEISHAHVICKAIGGKTQVIAKRRVRTYELHSMPLRSIAILFSNLFLLEVLPTDYYPPRILKTYISDSLSSAKFVVMKMRRQIFPKYYNVSSHSIVWLYQTKIATIFHEFTLERCPTSSAPGRKTNILLVHQQSAADEISCLACYHPPDRPVPGAHWPRRKTRGALAARPWEGIVGRSIGPALSAACLVTACSTVSGDSFTVPLCRCCVGALVLVSRRPGGGVGRGRRHPTADDMHVLLLPVCSRSGSRACLPAAACVSSSGCVSAG